MNKEHIAIQNPDITCCKCLKEKQNIKHLHIPALGYGSGFDCWSTQINLCDECLAVTNPEWWKLEIIDDEWGGSYKYEKKIFEFVNTLPLAGQELFQNRYSQGSFACYCMDSQDWIDYQLDILPHEKCKEYGIYSPQEIQAYKDRFPKCKHVELKIYGDGSGGTKCFRSAFGERDGSCGCNISNECYMCSCFEERAEDIKTVYVDEEELERERQRLKEMIKYATEKLSKMETK